MKDAQGREYAKYSELKINDKVELDGGFTCISAGKIREIKRDKEEFYFSCSSGHHYLKAHVMEDGDSLIGVYRLTS